MGYTTAILYSTAVCNLNCTYCYINKNKGLSAIDRVLAGSFADPDYYFDFIRDYFPHRGDLQNLEIWGAETFLHMERVHPTLHKLIGHYPFLRRFFASTNFSYPEWTDKVFDLLDTKKKILAYYQFFEGLIQQVVDLGLPNLNVNFPAPNMGVPTPAEKKDGQFFAGLVRNCRELEREGGHFRFYQEITPFSTNVRPKDRATYNYPCFNCGTGSANIGFLPGRLLSSCHNGFVDLLEDYEKEFLANPDSSIDGKLFQPTHNKFTHTEADYPAYERQIACYNDPNSLCRMGCLAGFIRTLAIAGEIDEKYATEEGAFRGAALYQSCTCNCLRDNYMVTGSTCLPPEGMIKLLRSEIPYSIKLSQFGAS